MLEDPQRSEQAMEQALRLRTVADTVDEVARRLDLRVETLRYEGPAARRFRAEMADRAQRAQRVKQRLQDLADRLNTTGA